jgi:hypothetical protein
MLSGRHDRCLALGAQPSLLHGAAEGPAGPFRAEAADRPRSIPTVRQLSQGGLQESGNSLPVGFACAGEHRLEQLAAGRDDLGCGPLATRRRPRERRNGLFAPVHGFDGERFDHPESDKREITADMMAEVFADEQLVKSEAKSRIMAKGFRKSAAYEALDPSGRFGEHLIETKKGMLKWKP